MRFIKKILGHKPELEQTAQPKPNRGKARVTQAHEKSFTVLVSWQEMIDEKSRISGYFLRINALGPSASISGPQLYEALIRDKVIRFAQRAMAIVPITAEQWMTADFRSLEAPHLYFLVSSTGNDELSAFWMTLIREIRSSDINVAITASLLESNHSASKLADLVLLDMQDLPLEEFETRIENIRLRHPFIPLVSSGVQSWAEHRFCQSLGINYSVGGFASTQNDISIPSQISKSRIIAIKLLNHLRNDEDVNQLSETAKCDPVVVLKLLSLASSPLQGITNPITSIEDAIVVLGRDFLYRWLTFAMFRIDAKKGRDETILVIALSRAWFLENLVKSKNEKMGGELFLVGLLSVVYNILGISMDLFLEKLKLPRSISSALLQGEGPYANYLNLTIAMERSKIDDAIRLANGINIDLLHLHRCYRSATEWAAMTYLNSENSIEVPVL